MKKNILPFIIKTAGFCLLITMFFAPPSFPSALQPFSKLPLATVETMAQNLRPLTKIKIALHDKKTNKLKAKLLVEYATNDPARAQGLMFRTSLPRDGGMLFLFDRQEVVYFWMKDTPLPLDLIFIGRDGLVKHIVSNATPYSEKNISSRYPVKWVLEILAGQAKQYGIAVGDRMVIGG